MPVRYQAWLLRHKVWINVSQCLKLPLLITQVSYTFCEATKRFCVIACSRSKATAPGLATSLRCCFRPISEVAKWLQEWTTPASKSVRLRPKYHYVVGKHEAADLHIGRFRNSCHAYTHQHIDTSAPLLANRLTLQ